ncbi:carboxymuconolactone decarboxylase family protein [Haliea sp. E17]|uniref:carboxymuconolactone decarboxylase family protein n=1 Tax=Haliea sp. E17 TaxID=3401576 RepID=UPI003AAC9B4D
MPQQTPRVPPLPVADFSERQKTLVGDWTEMNFARVTVRHPDMYELFLPYLARLIRNTSLPPRDREIVILRILALAGETYEAEHHVNIALNAGMSAAEIDAVKGSGSGLSEFDHLLMLAVEELMGDFVIGDPTWAGLSQEYSETQLMELVFLVGCYCTMGMLTKTFQIQLEEHADTSFQQLRDYT